MPIFRYRCRKCGADFELLLSRYDSPAECPKCASEDLQKQPSLIGAINSRKVSGCAMRDECAASGHCCGAGCGCGKH